jgi:hypothetical protein
VRAELALTERPWGYMTMCLSYSPRVANPEGEEDEELREWIGADFDTELFDKELVNKRLRKVFRLPARRHKRR